MNEFFKDMLNRNIVGRHAINISGLDLNSMVEGGKTE